MSSPILDVKLISSDDTTFLLHAIRLSDERFTVIPSTETKTAMTEPISMDTLLNTLLGDEVLGKDLSDADKATVKAMVQALSGDIEAELIPPASDLEMVGIEEISAELDTLVADLGVHSTDQPPELTMNDLLQDQSDANLVDFLGHQIESANDVVELLCYRPISKEPQVIDELRRVELQLVALSIGVSDLREAIEGRMTPQQRVTMNWKRRTKTLLLKEFNFINNWVRWL